MGYALTYTTTVNIHECITCGSPIALAADMETQRRRNHDSYYCPNGHTQYFPGKSDAEKLREAEAKLAIERSRAQAAQWAQERAAKNAARLLKRARAGVCPKCNRSFSALQRHMATKHPECA